MTFKIMKKVSKRQPLPLDVIPTPQQLLMDDLYLTSDEESEVDQEEYLRYTESRYPANFNADLDDGPTPPPSPIPGPSNRPPAQVLDSINLISDDE